MKKPNKDSMILVVGFILASVFILSLVVSAIILTIGF